MNERPVENERGAASDVFARLASAPFVIAVGALLLNDHVLKPALGNWITGKLSDFAGLFAFAFFWTALLPARRRFVFVATVILWLVWKSPLSDPFIHAWNALGVFATSRVVDYTDCLALLALIPAWRLATWDGSAPTTHGSTAWRPALRRRLVGVTSGVVAVLAFSATTIPQPRDTYLLGHIGGNQFSVSAAPELAKTGIKALGLQTYERYQRSSKKRLASPETLSVYIRQPPERFVAVSVELLEVSPAETRMTLLLVSTQGPVVKPESIFRAFDQQVVQPLRTWLDEQRTARDST